MGTAPRPLVGRDGTAQHHTPRRLRYLLRTRRRGGSRSAELPVAVHPDRILWADAWIHHVGFLHWNSGDESKRRASSGITLSGVAALPRAIHRFCRRQWQQDEQYKPEWHLQLLHGTWCEHHAEPVRARSAAALCSSQYATVEPDTTARIRQELGARSWIR